MLPIWVSKNPKKYTERIIWENESLLKYFPSFEMLQDNDGILFVEGNILTNSENLYSVRIYYPNEYPYKSPVPVILDKDVIEHCKKFSVHDYHYYDTYKGGLMICVMKPDDTVGVGWKPYLSVISVIMFVSKWLHAFEVKKETGVWILPEA